ncbi:MAG: hypothetical protein CVT79_06665 [Alphaproteobacteria bacterium HGW-Alphaproteobacteria-18]|nr:MAG: hypothetical protein CVT79_06665 [Alphaproteobacteria bacterium HGW-Alphaproteobacteria-18]
MKAAVLEERGAAGLKIMTVPDPERKPGEAIMKVRASSLNRVDAYMRDNGRGITHELPIILGVDGVGEILESEPGSGLKPGQRVMLFSSHFCQKCRYCLAGEQPLCLDVKIAGEHRNGSFAEYISMPARCFLPLPDEISFEDAGVLPAAYTTAYRMLFGKRPLKPGDSVLIVGAGGGVSAACIQLAKHIGARVLVTSSSAEKLRQAEAIGADAGVNYKTEPVSQRVMELTDGYGVVMAIDSVGEASWGDSLRSLRRGGCIISCGATTGGNPPVELQRMFIRQLELYGSTGGNFDEARRLLSLVANTGLKPVIDSRFNLDQISEGYDRLEAPERFGKVSIVM